MQHQNNQNSDPEVCPAESAQPLVQPAAPAEAASQKTSNMPSEQAYAALVEEYPDLTPGDIPQQVWEWAQQEGSLVSAYRKWEILQLKNELAALEMNLKNRQAAVGPAQSDGEPIGVDPVTLALLGR